MPSPSYGRSEHLDFVDAVRLLADRAGVALHEDAEVGKDRKRRVELLDALERAVVWYHERLLRAPDAGPARDYLRSHGYDGDVVRRFRLGWAPDDWDALSRALKLPERVLTDSGLGFVNKPGPGPRCLPGPRPVPDLRSLGPSGRPRWPGPPARSGAAVARAGRAEVQELPGVGHLLQAAHALCAQLGQARRHRPGRSGGVRGLYRCHRLLPGRGAPGRGHVWHGSGRGALHPVA